MGRPRSVAIQGAPSLAASCLSGVSSGLKDFHLDQVYTWVDSRIQDEGGSWEKTEQKQPEDLPEESTHSQPLGLPSCAEPDIAFPTPAYSPCGGSKVMGRDRSASPFIHKMLTLPKPWAVHCPLRSNHITE